jgi:hypothetical protein
MDLLTTKIGLSNIYYVGGYRYHIKDLFWVWVLVIEDSFWVWVPIGIPYRRQPNKQLYAINHQYATRQILATKSNENSSLPKLQIIMV